MLELVCCWNDNDDDDDDDEEKEWSVEMILYLIEQHTFTRLYLLSCEINSKFSIKIPALFV